MVKNLLVIPAAVGSIMICTILAQTNAMTIAICCETEVPRLNIRSFLFLSVRHWNRFGYSSPVIFNVMGGIIIYNSPCNYFFLCFCRFFNLNLFVIHNGKIILIFRKLSLPHKNSIPAALYSTIRNGKRLRLCRLSCFFRRSYIVCTESPPENNTANPQSY